jgi:alpha-beta hydrolase superfamily lysophospholipase
MSLLLAALAFAPRATVVMIHGAGGGGWEYDLWKPVFERSGYGVIARDLQPAHGSLAKTRFQDYVDQVVSWSPKSGSVVLIGASMGGPIALKAAEKIHPVAIVLVNGVPPKGVSSLPPAPAFPQIVKWANGPLKDTEVSMPDSDRETIIWAWKKWRNESGAVK